tara:strand:+ start:35 stop:457 length:423 start_codon:yes stop_codon:yes gene_type:complete
MKINLKKALWFSLGSILLVIAIIGVYLPGLPWSTPAVGAAFCFARSSERMHNWIMNHKLFGPFLTNWSSKRVFPTKAKYLMLLTMSSSLVLMWFTTGNIKAIMWTGGAMLFCAIWGWRYPGSLEEHERRKQLGLKVAWLK